MIQIKQVLEIRDMGPKKAIKNKKDKYSKDYHKIQISKIQALYLYLKKKKKTTILNLHNNLNII